LACRTSDWQNCADIESDVPEDITTRIAELRENSEPISVPENLPKHNPIFERWDAEDIRSRGIYAVRRPPLSPVEKRRRRILSSLMREVERWGGHVAAVDRQKFKAHVLGETLELLLRERLKQVQIPLTPDERRYSFYSNRDSKPSLESTDELILRLEDYFDRPIQKQWTDLKDRPLEGRLREVLIGLLIGASEVRRRRLEHEHRERERLQEMEERWAAEERRKAELARVDDLRAKAASWAEARQIRDFIAAAVRTISAESVCEVEAWVNWATTAANLMDPLTNKKSGTEMV